MTLPKTTSFRFDGERALVAGASSGIGLACVAAETTKTDFDAVPDLNVKGAYFLTQAVAKGLVAAGKSGGLDRAVYCAAKHAFESAVVYLTSKASSLVTGTSLLIDGRWTAE